MARVEFHPEFAEQFEALASQSFEVFEDVAALVGALETHGHGIEGEDHGSDPSHPIVGSALDMWALRRTPPTGFTPDANEPPVLRIPYVWMVDHDNREEYALVLFIGDKTEAQSRWYPAAVLHAENTLIPRWLLQRNRHEAKKKREAAMNNDDKVLTGMLPPLTGADDSTTSTKRVRQLLDDARSDPKHGVRIAELTSTIDAYVDRKATRLADLRRAAGLTQTQVADELGVSQPEVSKLEGRETHMIDTLARFVAATGGRLRMVVEYDDGTAIEYQPK